MHWFAKKSIPRPVVKNPLIKYANKTLKTRSKSVRPAPKTRSKSLARPRPRLMTLKAMPRNRSNLADRLSLQLKQMKNITNRLQNKEDMRRFVEQGIPQPRPQQKNKV